MDKMTVTSREGVSTIVDLLRHRAQERPQDRIMISDHRAEEVLGSSTYVQLDERARAIGALLQGFKAKGDRVLLLYAQGPAYLAALFGCFYAGTVAVPAQPPRDVRNLDKLQAYAEEIAPTVVLTTSLLLNSIRDVLREQGNPVLQQVRWIATDAVPVELAVKWQDAGVHGEMSAYLKYPTDQIVSHSELMGAEYIVRTQEGGEVLLAGELGFAAAGE